MAKKVLRSLLLERFPSEMRVDIDLLSRRRDITNEEKQDEILDLLRKYNMEITQLGAGTNRYAFKLDGYVIKVATDSEGKIDNFKEFKMTKRLFPYVTKTYEVSNNGTLLVAEYVQPFQSYNEMLQYADKIREILRKLSTVYLIGDVGITSKNYANWGLRVGSDEPVCLDFAYIYEVTSELFICSKCKTRSMLVPNNDFTELICPYKGCGKTYTFEDIRRRLGDDVHEHEIGDLTEEGYQLTQSNVMTELSPTRSNYLEVYNKKKVITVNVEDEVVEEDDDFVYNEKEEPEMSNVIKAIAESMTDDFMLNGKRITKATAVSVVNQEPVDGEDLYDDDYDLDEETPNGEDYNLPIDEEDDDDDMYILGEDEIPEYEDEGIDYDEKDELAFSGKIEAKMPPVEESQDPKYVTTLPKKVESAFKTESEPIKATVIKLSDLKEEKDIVLDDTVSLIQSSFYPNAQRAISKFANTVADFAYADQLFDDIRESVINKKFFAGDFQKLMSSVIFRSLADFVGLKEEATQDKNAPRKNWVMSKEFDGTESNYQTMLFIYRFWNTKEMNSAKNAEALMDAFDKHYPSEEGLQSEYVYDVFKSRLKSKMPATRSAYDIVCDYMAKFGWNCVRPKENNPTPPDPVVPAIGEAKELPDNSDEAETKEVSMDDMVDAMFNSMSSPYDENDLPSKNEDAEECDHNCDECEKDEQYCEAAIAEDEEEEEDATPISVLIYHEDDGNDVVKVSFTDEYGENVVPIYTNIANTKVSGFKDGKWQWLCHTVPDMVFKTKDADSYTEFNDGEDPDGREPLTKFVVLERGEVSTVGVFDFVGFFQANEEGHMIPVMDEEVIDKVCTILLNEFGAYATSPKKRTMQMTDRMVEEKELIGYIKEVFGDLISEESDEEDSGDDLVETLKAPEPESVVIEALSKPAKNVPANPAPPNNGAVKKNNQAPVKKAETKPESAQVFQPIRRAGAR